MVNSVVKAAIKNLGCRVNQYEAEALEQMFKNAGYQIVDFESDADLYLINSCAVTISAASKSRSLARQAKRRGGKDSIVIMAGCYTQVSPEEVEDVEEVDYLISTSNKDNLIQLLNDLKAGGDDRWLGSREEYEEIDQFQDFKLVDLNQTTRANIKIQDGCDQFCSYCIIPYARGRIRSRAQEDVIEEFRRLAAQGVKEFVLTGIHLGAYGKDFDGNKDYLADLLKELIDIKGNFRIRLSSIEAGEVTNSMLEIMRNSDKICSHLHLPLQSGSGRILEKMNRPYNQQEFLGYIENIKNRVPGIGLTTDIIVGFPGETEADFKETLKVVKAAGFSRLHIFSYSPRPGTPAARMKDNIDGDLKKERYNKLNQLGAELAREYRSSVQDNQLEVLFEDNRSDRMITGYTGNYIRVGVEYQEDLVNKLKTVELLEAKGEEPYPVKIIE
ncbi:tRNA (N(6)-L-threonylcarbamoyladenosine(37)-C(2))-methylthiotransferase MtaB [Halanaerobiaceae bacterium Z-7014]|uniref:tRNA (N(6)-L-threonylcarbamoyladenosine(37)-C(2))-methylthiotransferase MtaB n=1 Tax=Halonatronomonas betaini TaxID=2778430 RepID=A0A931AWD5_9FIRM|nr:tRNA (N(6)-L-threonylcarbamoyladenosine(37)-C(2))-methylthiotransferase MtaB [Halonatronomonas betaini]MBF8436013.1 tRNA (N(6)-L-threonylcarbamoyladenosine(37)-C(2))-methylthiotransferase MtaB [Halonatronomonas betaini]